MTLIYGQAGDDCDRDREVARHAATDSLGRLLVHELSGHERVVADHLVLLIGRNERACGVASIALTGRPDAMNDLYDAYDRLTPADLQRVAGRYFAPANETVVTLESETSQ